MTTLEIILVVVLSVVVVTTFLLYFINSKKINKKAKLEAEEKAKQKQDEEKAKKDAEKKEQLDKLKKYDQKQVVEAESDNEEKPAVAIITENTVEDNSDEQAKQVEISNDTNKDLDKSVAEQIQDLSPELKAILMTDILKPKF